MDRATTTRIQVSDANAAKLEIAVEYVINVSVCSSLEGFSILVMIYMIFRHSGSFWVRYFGLSDKT